MDTYCIRDQHTISSIPEAVNKFFCMGMKLAVCIENKVTITISHLVSLQGICYKKLMKFQIYFVLESHAYKTQKNILRDHRQKLSAAYTRHLFIF